MQLVCRNIRFKYPGSEVLLFQGLDIYLDQPGFHALFGPSGVGKSSLAKIICRQLVPDSGEVAINGMQNPLYGYNMERLPGWSSVGKHLQRITPIHNRSLKEALVTDFGLESILEQRFAQLSLGQQNRINLLRYLVQDFQALVMDESLANVDEKTRRHILLAIKKKFPDRLFLYISHNVIEVATYCRAIWVLRGAHKSPQAVAISGQDVVPDRDVDRCALQNTMLEIMNAA